jgi:hypothetical protein
MRYNSAAHKTGRRTVKLARNLGIGLAVLAAIIVAAVIFLLSSLDTIVAGAIQKYGSQVTQTPVRVSSVSIDLKSGSGAISELRVGNPDGFKATDIFTLGGINTRIDTATVTQDPIIIDEISINAPRVVYEINKAGASNIKALEQNIAASSGTGKSGSESSGSSEGPRLVIRKFVIDSGEIEANVAALGDKQMSAKLPRIQLTDIGKKSGGATGAEVAKQVTQAIIAKVGLAVASLGLEKYVGKSLDEAKALIGDTVDSKAVESAGEAAGKGKESLKKLLGD